jgi:hypothetical protein
MTTSSISSTTLCDEAQVTLKVAVHPCYTVISCGYVYKKHPWWTVVGGANSLSPRGGHQGTWMDGEAFGWAGTCCTKYRAEVIQFQSSGRLPADGGAGLSCFASSLVPSLAPVGLQSLTPPPHSRLRASLANYIASPAARGKRGASEQRGGSAPWCGSRCCSTASLSVFAAFRSRLFSTCSHLQAWRKGAATPAYSPGPLRGCGFRARPCAMPVSGFLHFEAAPKSSKNRKGGITM